MNRSHDDPTGWNGKWRKNRFKDRDNRISYLQWLGKKLGFSAPSDWYKVRYKDFVDNKGASFLNRHYGTILNAVSDLFPDYDWLPWLFAGGVPDKHWDDATNRRAYMDWLGKKLGYSKREDWYGVTQGHFMANGGNKFMVYFGKSPSKAVMTIYPDSEWHPWKFQKLPNRYWFRDKNIRAYLEWLAKELGYFRPEDWYGISSKILVANYGTSLLGNIWRGKPSKAAYFFFPVYDYLPWLFNQVPPNWWKDIANRQKYLLWLGQRLGYSKKEDWYGIKKKNFEQNDGGGFLMQYYNSPSNAIMKLYPDFRWRPWLFDQTRKEFWNKRKNRRAYMDWLSDVLEFDKHDDWYHVGQKTIEKNHGRGVLKQFSHSIPALVDDTYPDYDWKPDKFTAGLKTQKRMYSLLKKLYPNNDVKWNFWHPELRFSETGAKMQIDVFLPKLHLGFEYQGEQHYLPMKMYGGKDFLKQCQDRDAQKRIACAKANVRLIEVPYWWDNSKAQLEQMIEAGPGEHVLPSRDL